QEHRLHERPDCVVARRLGEGGLGSRAPERAGAIEGRREGSLQSQAIEQGPQGRQPAGDSHPEMTAGATAPPRAADQPASSLSPRSEVGGPAPVQVREVSKVYGDTSNAVHALDKVSLTLGTGEFVCILGASGCGKSTLLS